VAVEVPVTPPDKLAAARERMRVRRAIARTDTPEGARLRHLRREANEAFRDDIREMLDAAKVGGCVDCGRTDLPAEVLDFDHVRGERKFSLSKATAHGKRAVREELAKCDVRCPTCHALRHYHNRTATHGRFF
jgi:integrase